MPQTLILARALQAAYILWGSRGKILSIAYFYLVLTCTLQILQAA